MVSFDRHLPLQAIDIDEVFGCGLRAALARFGYVPCSGMRQYDFLVSCRHFVYFAFWVSHLL